MESQNKTASDILNEVANLLELELIDWGKGTYFTPSPESIKRCLMCAHGAIAYCSNPKVKQFIDNGERIEAQYLIHGWRKMASVSGSVAAAGRPNLSIPNSIKTNKQYLAHYKAARAGLTFNYNDDHKTTKQDIIKKLREAALL